MATPAIVIILFQKFCKVMTIPQWRTHTTIMGMVITMVTILITCELVSDITVTVTTSKGHAFNIIVK